jgi:hypothetical protein
MKHELLFLVRRGGKVTNLEWVLLRLPLLPRLHGEEVPIHEENKGDPYKCEQFQAREHPNC